ncbi:MarR family winged helix-turn-helix transcriptional regulator [Sphingomonas sp. DT-204]|uniref:MarR family winged helix-turn-helix transcriptional regulator n=1 Tax=Sphingomonas sp. DT-204 TaxID=3396166 RepID=UPI003F1D0611
MATASPLFLTEPEIRRGIELLFFGYGQLTRAIDLALEEHDLGRAHQRALYFIARRPNLSVGELLGVLAITKQSLARVLADLSRRGLVESRPGDRDRRQRLLRLTVEGAAIEARLFQALSVRMAEAYSRAGQEAVGGFWGVLEGLVPVRERGKLLGR